MPRYDYECEACHHRFEMKQSFDSSPVQMCPECQSVARRQFHSVPIVFKGSGWYVNDYGKRSSSASSSSDESKETKDTSDSTSKSEGKKDSATKSKSKTESVSTKAKGD